MSYTSYWKGNPGKTQTPSKKNTSAAISAPRTPADSSWTLMDENDLSPPTYPDVGTQARPTDMPSQSSTQGTTAYPMVTSTENCQDEEM